MRKGLLTCAVSLVAAALAQPTAAAGRSAEDQQSDREGSAPAVSVENAVGDAMLTCAVPERLARKRRRQGGRAGPAALRLLPRPQLVRLEHVGERAKRPESRREAGREACGREAGGAGVIVELGPASIVAGSVPEGLAGRVAEHFVLGDRVKMTCRGSELTYLETVV